LPKWPPALATAGLPASCLSIEVTETAVLDDDVATATLHALRDLALDDFGTAASSLGLLLTCPVTTLKLDRSFVEEVTTVDRQQAVPTAVSQIAYALRLRSVAEGIETHEQARLLQDLGYQYARGFLFSRPLPPDQVAAMWASPPGTSATCPRSKRQIVQPKASSRAGPQLCFLRLELVGACGQGRGCR
jgi:EAL domain-containing protein (putative c-di-GMP-specific phosphodiesterase class I)